MPAGLRLVPPETWSASSGGYLRLCSPGFGPVAGGGSAAAPRTGPASALACGPWQGVSADSGAGAAARWGRGRQERTARENGNLRHKRAFFARGNAFNWHQRPHGSEPHHQLGARSRVGAARAGPIRTPSPGANLLCLAGTTAGPGTSSAASTASTAPPATTSAATPTGTSRIHSSTSVAPGSTVTAAPTSPGESGTTGVRSTAGTSKETSETSPAAGSTTTRCPETRPPAPVCHGPLGEEKSPGDSWTSNCYQCTCTNAKTVDCQPKDCPSLPTCKTGEKLVVFTSNDTCCEVGYCEPRTCFYNNTDYEIGASFEDPSNPCISYSCSDTGLVAVVQSCPKQTWCAEKERTYDSNKCCYKCNTNCRTSPVNVTVNYNNCKKKVEMARCVGECKKTLQYNYEVFQLKNSCLCCREENYEYRDIDLDCPDGSILSYQYRHTTTCSCADLCQNS
ncbi:apomucin [Cavia porcellus]|uniref:apomucin n=1 Tax=Cavia porcellus TaxID=10141 RepID=UPI002FE01F24